MIPLGLRTVLESGQGVLFLGAGIGYCAFDSNHAPMPDAATLARDLAGAFSVDAGADPDLAKVAQIVELRKGRAELNAFLTERLSGFEPDESLRWLFGLTWRAIFTTNYDRVIERTYDLLPDPTQTPVTISYTSEVQYCNPLFQVPVYHLHGALFDVPEPHVLITQEDYARFRNRRQMLFEILKKEMATSTIIYLGYSHDDPNWKAVRLELREEFEPSALPPSFRITPATDPLDREILEAQDVVIVDAGLGDFVAEASHLLGRLRVEPHKLDSLRQSVPSDLLGAFESNAASTVRLLNSWVYVNQAPFDGAVNTDRFLKGERPSWATIGQRHHFARDIEESIFECLLDYATLAKTTQPVLLILAPAGYGVTTVLMSLAAAVVREDAGPVFMHRLGTPISEGDIEFACSLFANRPYFVIDNATDSVSPIRAAIVHMKKLRRPACFLLGERRNEWRQMYRSLRAREFAIDPLSEPEIQRLLSCLERHSALGVLADLEPELRAAAVREKHDRQLLVAMREATEGKAFDAIIEDEYRNIGSDLARTLYATVSCAYKLRKYVRDVVLSDVLGVPLQDMYRETNDALDGVVEYDCIDEYRGSYGARCRHHAIAEIVWERCVEDPDRQTTMLRITDALNINYHVDSEFFEAATRSDRHVDCLSAFDAKVEFFECACRKDPRNPYVRQHYARMLLREKKPELALSQIDHALDMAPGVRILLHTKGVILGEIAMSAPSVELARRRLVQSEAAFRQAIRRGKRDAYPYQSLAELYLDWAMRAPTEEETAHYVAKCEQVIAEGLAVVRRRESLWIASSRVQKVLGDRPKAIEALKKASDSPIAQYLLGQAYLQAGDPERATSVLRPVLEEDPKNHRVAMLYARALLERGEPYAKGIAALRLASLYGMREPRYVATLGGMLFMNGDLTESEKVFADAGKRHFPLEEERHVHYRPHMPSHPEVPFELEGEVVAVKPGYIWLGVPGYPNIFCRMSKVGSVVLRNGAKLRFQLGFNARGPLAHRCELAEEKS